MFFRSVDWVKPGILTRMRACRWVQDLLQKDGMIVTKDRGHICHHTFENIQGDLVLT